MSHFLSQIEKRIFTFYNIQEGILSGSRSKEKPEKEGIQKKEEDRNMLNVLDRNYLNAKIRGEYAWKRMTNALKQMREDEAGGTATVVIEIVMIGMVLVLGYVFRDAIGGLFESLWKNLVTFSDTPNDVTVETISNPF